MDLTQRREHEIRMATFDWLADQVDIYGDVLPRPLLSWGFESKGQRISLISQQGIFKPRVFKKIPLSITTTMSGPYDDNFDSDGLLKYKYRGTDPMHSDNVGLRMAMQQRVPLVYFHAVFRGKYLAVWPVYIVGDNPTSLTFTVAVDDVKFVNECTQADWDSLRIADSSEDQSRRVYITTTVRQRLHQRSFREKVLRAYRDQCAFCRLKHLELLDAAHIVPDNEPGGDPVVTNGLALCKLHHAAFDKYFLGVRPDYTIVVRDDVLEEQDGPMLLHGLQGLHRGRIVVPSRTVQRPDPELLRRRYERFQSAG